MSYERRVIEIEAVQLVRAIFDSEGNRLADKGEWLIVDGDVQLYMKDVDFQREFVRKAPEKEIVVQKEIDYQWIPYEVEKPIYINPRPCPPSPCPDIWIPRPWWQQYEVICWSDSSGYTKTHTNLNDCTTNSISVKA